MADPLVITAAFAIIVSIISIIITMLSNRQQMKHNKNSVRPLCEILVNDGRKILVKIANKGTGPLIIKSVISKKCVCEKPCKSPTKCKKEIPAEDVSNADLRSLISPEGYTYTSLVTYVENRAVAVGGEIILIEFSPPDSKTKKQEIRDNLAKITIFVTYTNVYNEKMPVRSRRLDIFKDSGEKSKWVFAPANIDHNGDWYG